jgi:hypothetical protein
MKESCLSEKKVLLPSNGVFARIAAVLGGTAGRRILSGILRPRILTDPEVDAAVHFDVS